MAMPSNSDRMTLTILVLDTQNLTLMETTVLQLLCRGLTRKEIARQRHRSVGTVSHHVENIAKKLQANSTAEIVAKAVARGIVSIGLQVVVWLLVGLGVFAISQHAPPSVPVEAVFHVIRGGL
jgi:DNA-binding CsgD family transcriptional regulator